MAISDLIQVVDEHDNVIGQDTVRNVREKGSRCRIARIMIEDGTGKKILLQKRVKDSHLYPGRWDNSAAGHVDVGETYEDAAYRELFEEIGIKTDNLRKIGKYYNSTTSEKLILNQFNTVYKCVSNDTPISLQKEEVSSVEWFTIDDIKKMIKTHPEKFTSGLVDVINRYY